MDKSMLPEVNLISNEPLISVGLILPEDKKSSILIEDTSIKKKYRIKVKSGQIIINNKIEMNPFNFKSKSKKGTFIIKKIKAGRGFHWEKDITINVTGELILKSNDQNIILVNKLKLEDYIASVATSEMSKSCPSSFLESQTIAARSWVLASAENKHEDLNVDVCNDDCCQRYQGIKGLNESAISSANKTRGYILTSNHKICDTRYSKSCGGISENNEIVWFNKPIEYLRAVYDSKRNAKPRLMSEKELNSWIDNPDSCFCDETEISKKELKSYLGHVDKMDSYFRWSYSLKQQELCALIREKAGHYFDSIVSLVPISRGVSGRINLLKINGYTHSKPSTLDIKSEYEIRRILHPKFLYSSAFIIIANSSSNRPPDNFTFKGAGWGHGVGLCQIGALNMALKGYSHKQILYHYFLNSKLKKLYE